MTTVGLIPCLPPGLHPGMDALAHGAAGVLEREGVGFSVFAADLRGGQRAIAESQARAIDTAVAQGVSALILFVLQMREPAAAVARALARSIPVLAIHRPAYPVSAAIMVPNYHQGVVLGQALARAVGGGGSGSEGGSGKAARVAILGGPHILDDIELVGGAIDGVQGSGLQLVNNPFEAQYRNLDDVRGGGKRAAERLLADHFPFAGWVVFNDETLVDALAVLEARGLRGRVACVSRNGSPSAIAELRRGRTTATFDYHLPELGVLAGRTALELLAQPETMNRLVSAPFGELYTASNVDRYVPWVERARHGELNVVVPAGAEG